MQALLLELLRGKVDKTTFDSFLKDLELKALDVENATVQLVVPGEMARNWVDGNLRGVILEFFQDELGRGPHLEVRVKKGVRSVRKSEAKTTEEKPVATAATEETYPRQRRKPVSQDFQLDEELHLVPNHTFDNFIVGKSNKLAHAASLAVAKDPGKGNPYNPLYLYSESGLGKSHLLHAIAHQIHKKKPDLTIRLLTAETFMTELLDLITRKKPTKQFRQKYRGCDVFIIEDIALVGGKGVTAEEFFHTFNTLYEAGAQIIISSDKHPREIQGLQDRLSTRLGWGLIVDMQPPDFETRLLILRNKCALHDIEMPDHVLARIAQRVKNNVRDLEAALTKLIAHARLMGIAPEDALEPMLQSLFPGEPLTLQLGGNEIIDAVAEEFQLTPSLIKSARRKKELVEPRHLAMYLVREHTQLSFEDIGELFGGRHHATVLKGADKVRQKPSKRQVAAMDRIREKLGLQAS